MILVGIDGCATCKIAKKFLSEIEYIQLSKNEKTTSEILKIKKALGKLNTSNNFPIILNDDYTKLIDTEFILDNLNEEKIRNKLANQ